jgi:hypothetical protein
MSTKTWGIELRSCGKLRPHTHDEIEPPPIMSNEETDFHFRKGYSDFPEQYNYYWKGDLWRKRFEGKVYSWEGYYYELPTAAQIETLFVILMAMNAIVGKLDKRIILPSNCVKAHLHPFPIIPWYDMRGIVTTRWDEYDAPDIVDELFVKDPYTWEGYDLDYYDEGTVGEQLDVHRWRTYANDGQLESIDWEIKNEKILSPKEVAMLRKLGYSASDHNFALQMYALSRGMITPQKQDIITALNQGITTFD